jgi:predicted PurR-regulated permease PerM
MNAPAAESNSKSTFFQRASFLLYLFVVSVAFLYLLRNFLMPLLMAAVFTGLTYPIYAWLLAKIGRKAPSALLTLLALVVVLVVPLAGIGFVAYQEAVRFFEGIDLDAARAWIEGFVGFLRERFPGLLDRVNPRDLAGMASGALQNAGQFVLKNSANISLSVANNLLNFFLMLFIMFYFYVDGERIVSRLIRWSPLKDEYERILIDKFVTVSKGTLKGILVIGVIQGVIGAILFWAVGLRSPVFLGSLMIFASVVPAVGTAIVWVPVALLFVLQGKLVLALVVAAVGGGVIGMVDNLIRPILVGKDIKMHDLLVLLSTLGGLGIFGLSGFVIGPIIASLFLSIWNIYEEIFEDELTRNRQVGFRTERISRILKSPPPATESPSQPGQGSGSASGAGT